MKCMFQRWSIRARDLIKSREGAVMPMVGLGAIALIGAMGVAIETARIQLVQARLSSSLDAAGLAAGSSINTQNITSEVNKYLNGNFGSYMGSTLGTPTIVVNGTSTKINLTATATVPLTFMKIFGQTTTTVRATSEITRANKGLELVMVLDNTGSMEGTKLASLKTAATDLVNILYGSGNSNNLWIGLVPFSQGVNIGSSRTNWLDSTHFAGLNWGPTSWGGCVDSRNNSRDTTDDPPATQSFKAYYWPDHDDYNNWIRSDGTYRSITSTRGPNKYCPQSVTPMTANINTLTAAINAMVADGNTQINEGAAWGWRMISPRWRSLWGGEMNTNNLPLDYNAPNMNKAVIIMTDGDNTISNSSRGSYGYLNEGNLGTTSQSAAETQLDTRLSTVCTRMKNNNIYVYTIAFGSISTSSQTMLRNCATQPDYYFASPTNEALQQAFRAIGDSLSDLRVSQ